MKLDLVNEFVARAASLEVEEFLGLTNLLNVPLTTEAHDHRPFEDVFIDTVVAFSKMGRKQKRELIKVLRRVEKDNKEMRATLEEEAASKCQ